jgi:uncharacterized protein involved in exopolysaccharide biosynthesis
MTPPSSALGTLARAPVFREPGKRRVLFLVLIAICAVLSLFPRHYRAATSLTPTDPGSLGLSGTLGQLGAGTSIFGNQTAVEVSLKVARSRYVRDIVAKRLDLARKLGKTPLETDRWLDRKLDIRSLRGGIIQFELKLRDPQFARQVIAAYADAVRQELGSIARKQTAYKRQILVELVQTSSEQLAEAQDAYDTFRLKSRYIQPQQTFYTIGQRIPELEATIRAKEVQLNAARQFATDRNMSVAQIVAEIDALKAQLAQARSISNAEPSTVGRLVRESTTVDKLRRNLELAQGLYDSYKRFLQGTSVEDLTSTANVRILEPAYVDSARQYNLLPLGLGLVLLLLALAIEFYAMRPPIADRSLA